jgi:hypothetical protein
MPLYSSQILIWAKQPSAKLYIILGLLCLLLSAVLGSA